MPPGAAPGFIKPNASMISNEVMIIGNDLRIISKGTLQIDGEIRGDLYCSQVIVLENGKVTGTVAAESVVVNGEVQGLIRGVKVELQSNARVEADIHLNQFVVEPGAYFEGSIRRSDEMAALMPVLDPAALT